MNPRVPRLLPGMAFDISDFNLDGLVKTITHEQLFGEVLRISGDALCPICSHPAQDHPMCGQIKSADNEPFLHVLCDRRRVKL